MFLSLIKYFVTLNSIIIFNFNHNVNIRDWQTTNDTVMGGVSQSSIYIDNEGYGVFSGKVSTENNGGFAMIRHSTSVKCDSSSKIVLRIKGDKKKYQLRLKSNNYQQFWYVHTFETTGEWQTIQLNLGDFYPSFRGYKLNKPNFSENQISEVAFLIGNKKTEFFELKIDKIILE